MAVNLPSLRLVSLTPLLLLALTFALQASGRATPPRDSSTAATPYELNLAALAARKLYFGTATNNVELNDTAYFDVLDDFKMFGQITPAKGMKWVRPAFLLSLSAV